MSENKAPEAGNVIPLRPAKETGRASEKKWGKDVIALGFCIVPSLVTRLKKLEPDFRKVEEDARKARRAVSRRGFRVNGAIGEGNRA